MDKLAAIRAFVKVVQSGNFSKAAEELRLSRSAVSKSVIDLERELGIQLLRRTTRSVSPTEQGRAYFDRCTAILTELDELDVAVGSFQSIPRGVLRINAPMSFGTLHLSRSLGDFMERYPEIRLELILSDQLIDPVAEGFDVTLRIGDMAPSSLIARQIVPAKRVVCAAAAYLERRGTPLHPSELRNHDCLNYGYLATGNQWKLSGTDGDHWIQPRWRMCTNNAQVLRDAAVHGQGIALLPTFIVGADLQQGTLRTILPGFSAPETSLCAIYAPTRRLAKKIRVFIDFLVERFGGRPYWDLVE
jgi:DNA-binding transcriptional LysR family regulator